MPLKSEIFCYTLNLELCLLNKVKHHEGTLEQLGKDVVSCFLLASYYATSHKICFSETDNIMDDLVRIWDNSRQLWCNGKSPLFAVVFQIQRS